MDLRYLQSFVAVVEFGSLAEAARRLDLTPAAIAARVHELELDLGATLFKRAGRSVHPTEAGMKILDRARSVLRDVRDLRAVAGDGKSLGELRLGVFISAMISVLPPVLRGLYGKHPELNVFVELGHSVDLCRQVSAGALDAAIVVEPQFALGKNCEWRALVEEPLVVVAPASMAGADPHVLLRTEPFIRYDRSVLGGQLGDRYLRDQGIRPHQRLEIDGLMAIATLVGQGLGVALIPDWTPMWSSNLDIARVPLPGRPPVRRVGLVWAPDGPRAALADAFLLEAREVFGKPPRERPIALRKLSRIRAGAEPSPER
ncbi:MAG: LysR family transcriptional regulator [Holophaga sp.]|nr:LysR family transcriptional regulator [Holophaga sp.]